MPQIRRPKDQGDLLSRDFLLLKLIILISGLERYKWLDDSICCVCCIGIYTLAAILCMTFHIFLIKNTSRYMPEERIFTCCFHMIPVYWSVYRCLRLCDKWICFSNERLSIFITHFNVLRMCSFFHKSSCECLYISYAKKDFHYSCLTFNSSLNKKSSRISFNLSTLQSDVFTMKWCCDWSRNFTWVSRRWVVNAFYCTLLLFIKPSERSKIILLRCHDQTKFVLIICVVTLIPLVLHVSAVAIGK